MNREAPFTVEELNAAWQTLIGQFVVNKLNLEKEITQLIGQRDQLVIENDKLTNELSRLREKLNSNSKPFSNEAAEIAGAEIREWQK